VKKEKGVLKNSSNNGGLNPKNTTKHDKIKDPKNTTKSKFNVVY